ncbi:MAG: hypothetical protein KAR31_13555, partial [Candidatus Omnitrophica bacterium]|nr:hypothetical protein [Candidatus Omnitrophota bacterium]
PYTITELPGTIIPTTLYTGAFIMNEHLPEVGGVSVVDPCWDLAHGFLSQGVVNETCAHYFWSGAGMELEFVRC